MKRSYSLRPGEKGEWIPALEAVHLLAPSLGSDRKAKKALFERLKDSAIQTTAWWIATGFDVGEPYAPLPVVLPGDGAKPLSAAESHDLVVERSKPQISQTRCGTNKALTLSEGDIILGGLFWNLATKEDQRQWNWSSGLFKCSYPTGDGLPGLAGKAASEGSSPTRMRMYAMGVHFHRPDVVRIIDANGVVADPSIKPPSNRGRKRSDDWPRWVAEVIALHEEEGIATLTAYELVEKVENRMASAGVPVPVSSTVYKAAQETLKLLMERKAKRTEFP